MSIEHSMSPEEKNRAIEWITQSRKKVLKYKDVDPETALFHSRRLAEGICKQVYILEGCERGGKPSKKMMLGELVPFLDRKGLLPGLVGRHLGTIQHFGNYGAHDQGMEAAEVTPAAIKPCIEALNYIVSWFSAQYLGTEIRNSRGAEVYADRYRVFLLNDGRVDQEEEQTLQIIAEAHGLSDDQTEHIRAQVQAEEIVDAEVTISPSATTAFPIPGNSKETPYQWADPESSTHDTTLTMALSFNGITRTGADFWVFGHLWTRHRSGRCPGHPGTHFPPRSIS